MNRRSSQVAEHAAMMIIWLGLILLFGFFSENFLTWRTVRTMANQIPALTVVSAGMTLVLVIGGIDLSVGSVLGWCGSVLGVALVNWHWPILVAMPACLALGAVVGGLNGALIVE